MSMRTRQAVGLYYCALWYYSILRELGHTHNFHDGQVRCCLYAGCNWPKVMTALFLRLLSETKLIL